MAENINRVIVSGNIGRDPELRSTAGGSQILSFSLAVNDRTRDKSTGEWTDRINWVDCVVFGARADPLSRFLSKGAKVAVEGKLRYSSWESKDGGKRSKLEVVVDEVEFMSRDGGAYQQPAPQPEQQSFTAAAPAPATPAAQVYDDDVPFDQRPYYGA